MNIYLADLGHNLLTKSSDVYPLGIANLATWLERESPGRHQFRLFREPQDLRAAIEKKAPDLIGFSNYAWNFQLTRQFASWVKKRSPGTLVVVGGPNWPLVESEQEIYLRESPQFDVAVEGPTYEGERAFANLVGAFDERGAGGLVEEIPAGSVWIDPRDGSFRRGGPVARIENLDDIPSPYLSGLLDPFFATDYFPMMQIARGCPFTCAFCNSGVQSNGHIYAHSIENVKADLLYIADRVRPEINLCLADDNFGMYQRDEEIADYIAWLRAEKGWPNYIRTTTGKNNTKRILRVLRKIKGMLPMTAAVQSMNPVVLENIKRSNIKLETYAAIQGELEEQGLQSYGELILCLPGETKESFLKAVSDLMDSGAKRISAHQLMLLHGAELANPELREKFQFDTRFRVVARNVGDYLDEPVVEVEEMVVATPTFSFDDYLECRVFHLLLTIFFYEGNYDEAFKLAESRGIRSFDLVRRMQERLPLAPAALQKLIDEFIKESCEEIFLTADECLAWAHAHYAELVSGELGGNLLSKYSLSGRFWLNQPSLDFLADTIRDVSGPGEGEDAELDCVMDFLAAGMIAAPFAESLAVSPEWTTSYDLLAWLDDHSDAELRSYRLDEPREYVFEAEPAKVRLIMTKVEAFGENPQGLGKITRTMFARDLRRTPRLESARERHRA